MFKIASRSYSPVYKEYFCLRSGLNTVYSTKKLSVRALRTSRKLETGTNKLHEPRTSKFAVKDLALDNRILGFLKKNQLSTVYKISPLKE